MSEKKGRTVKDEVFAPRNKKEIEQEKARIAREAPKHAEAKKRVEAAMKTGKTTKKK